MRTYTYEETLQILIDVVVEEGGNFVYYGDPDQPEQLACYYVKDGSPSCAVGRVLVKVGVPVEDLEGTEHHVGPYGNGTSGTVLRNLEVGGVVNFDPKSRRLLGVMQYHQDYRAPWGESLMRARMAAEEM